MRAGQQAQTEVSKDLHQPLGKQDDRQHQGQRYQAQAGVNARYPPRPRKQCRSEDAKEPAYVLGRKGIDQVRKSGRKMSQLTKIEMPIPRQRHHNGQESHHDHQDRGANK